MMLTRRACLATIVAPALPNIPEDLWKEAASRPSPICFQPWLKTLIYDRRNPPKSLLIVTAPRELPSLLTQRGTIRVAEAEDIPEQFRTYLHLSALLAPGQFLFVAVQCHTCWTWELQLAELFAENGPSICAIGEYHKCLLCRFPPGTRTGNLAPNLWKID